MKCIVIDDEPLAREGIKQYVDEISDLQLIGSFKSAMNAGSFLQEQKVDLMFLDIQMPGVTGPEFLKTLQSKPLTIMTTAYTDYAIESFELDVVDYLLKPIRLARFIKAVNKAKELFELYQRPHEVEKIENDFIYVKADRKFVKIFYNEINYIKGLKDYVSIHTNDKKIITAMNVKTILSHLPKNIFYRVNKSYIINIDKIDTVETDFVNIIGEEIPIGHTYKDAFINDVIKGKLIKR